MSTQVWILLIGSLLIIAAGIVFRKQLARVPIHYAVLFFLGVLVAFGSKKAAEKVRDIEGRLPL